jgi:RND superfamily putative drug exporter
MSDFLGRLARAASTHSKRALALVVVTIVGLGALAGALGGTFADDFKTPGVESQQAIDLLQARFPAAAGDSATVVFSVAEGTVRDGERAAAISSTIAAIAKQPHVTGVVDPLSKQGAGQMSRDGRIAFANVQYDQPAIEMEKAPAERLEAAAKTARSAGVDVAMRGQVIDVAEQQDAPVGEIIGVAAAILVLTLVFRSLVAMAITLVASLIALIAGSLLLTIGASVVDFPSIAPTLGVMLGLGAGVDYALLLVGRYREQRAAGDDGPDAAARAAQTAGVAVLAAGAIVVVAISGLLAVGIPFVGRMGLGAAVVVATVAVGAVTILPAFLGLAAKRLAPKRPEHVAPSAAFERWGDRLTRHRWPAAIGGALVLLVLASPVLDLRLGMPDDGNDAPETTTREAYEQLAAGFGPGFNGPLILAARLPADGDARPALERIQQAVADTDGVAVAAPPTVNEAGDAATITVVPTSSPQDPRTSELVDRLRDETLPAATRGTGVDVYVGGITAAFDDLSSRIAERLPVFILAVIGLSVLLLMAVFRSVWVPLVSAVFNLLSIGAAYGVVTAVFQWGWLAGLLGVSGTVPIVSFVPLLMFAILFGLSMDYNVFLLSRIREEYVHGASAHDSITVGLARVAKIILGAGAIMTAVFLGFVTGHDVIIKMMGVGLATAILLDVLVVRLVVAPAVLALLGDRAWWFPAWLDRVLPKLSLEGPEPEPEPSRA